MKQQAWFAKAFSFDVGRKPWASSDQRIFAGPWTSSLRRSEMRSPSKRRCLCFFGWSFWKVLVCLDPYMFVLGSGFLTFLSLN